MPGEPVRKFATDNPRPLGGARDLRTVAAAKAAAEGRAVGQQRGRGERRGPERVRLERAGGLHQAIDEPASEQIFFLPEDQGSLPKIKQCHFHGRKVAIASVSQSYEP